MAICQRDLAQVTDFIQRNVKVLRYIRINECDSCMVFGNQNCTCTEMKTNLGHHYESDLFTG